MLFHLKGSALHGWDDITAHLTPQAVSPQRLSSAWMGWYHRAPDTTSCFTSKAQLCINGVISLRTWHHKLFHLKGSALHGWDDITAHLTPHAVLPQRLSSACAAPWHHMLFHLKGPALHVLLPDALNPARRVTLDI